jgi:hypothetical protein
LCKWLKIFLDTIFSNILKSYLTNRSQKVAIKEALSELEDLKAGVPQGSVSIPPLFYIV